LELWLWEEKEIGTDDICVGFVLIMEHVNGMKGTVQASTFRTRTLEDPRLD
jgi:hypothetical protein